MVAILGLELNNSMQRKYIETGIHSMLNFYGFTILVF